MLQDPNLIGRIQRILHVDMFYNIDEKLGVVGEPTLALYGFLAMLGSRPVRYVIRNIKRESVRAAIPRYAQMVIVVGGSRSGKTRISNTISWFFSTKVIGASSARYLLYEDLTNYDVIYLQELFNRDNTQEGSQIRIIADEDGGLVFGTVEVNESGKLVPTSRKIDPRGFIITTTRNDIEQQLANRSHVLNTNESEEQTRAIILADADIRKKMLLIKLGKLNYINESFVLKRAVQVLDRDVELVTTCPFSVNEIWPNFKNLRIRSDTHKLQSMILLSAFLHQYQRPYIIIKDGETEQRVVFAIAQDYYNVLELVRESVATMNTNLDERSRMLLPFLRELSKMKVTDSNGITVEGFTVLQAYNLIREDKTINISIKTLERRLFSLEDAGILEVFKTRGTRNVFRVLPSEDELDTLINIGSGLKLSDKLIDNAILDSKSTFKFYKSYLGDNFKIPGDRTFEVDKTPQWFTSGNFENYKIIEKQREQECLGVFEKSSVTNSFMMLNDRQN